MSKRERPRTTVRKPTSPDVPRRELPQPTDETAARKLTGEKPPAPPARRSRLRRERSADEPEQERLTVYLPPDLAEALRVHCARHRRSLSDAVTEAVRAMVTEN